MKGKQPVSAPDIQNPLSFKGHFFETAEIKFPHLIEMRDDGFSKNAGRDLYTVVPSIIR
jgi:hypothetical protein